MRFRVQKAQYVDGT